MEIDVEIINETVFVENIGNVRYTEELLINASDSEGVVYKIPYEIDLRPGEKGEINIGDDLPAEAYNLIVSSGNISFNFDYNQSGDDRSFLKKMSQGISRITGSSVIEVESLSNVYVLGFVFVFLGFVFVFILQRRFSGKVMGVIDNTVKVQGKKIGGLQESIGRHKQERNKLREMFGKYVDEGILKRGFEAGTKKKEISVLFTDIRGYSKIFDKLDSKEITHMLNLYFSKSSEIIKKHKGFINKFIGDSVMALFNAVEDDKEHVVKAIISALEIKKEIVALNIKLKERGLSPIDVGIGVDSGVSSVGNLGSKDKMEFTAIGVPVNIAFRLQGMSDGKILITEKVYNKIKDKFIVSLFGEFEMKNITGKVKVYSVVGVR